MDELRTDDPRRIGAYRLLGRLGTGGMGIVYLARSARGRTVAVKLVRAELAAQEEFRDRFRREVQAARRVGGTWTAPVLDADTEAEIPWVATGYVAGPSLSQVVREHGPLPERSVRVLATGLARALADIHAAGLIHRDLKPSNVMITIDGPRVIDFGIARALETVTDASLTGTGGMVGSPAFMSPEQVRGDRLTSACDVFCMGSVLAYAATGLQPFGAASSGVHAQMFRIAQEPPDLTAVPAGLRDLVAACLVKDPQERPSLDRVRDMAAALAPAGADAPPADEPWLPGAIVARLGRHAVRLLELEADGTGSLPVVPAPAPAEPAAAVVTATAARANAATIAPEPAAMAAPVEPLRPVEPVEPMTSAAPVRSEPPYAPAPTVTTAPTAPTLPAEASGHFGSVADEPDPVPPPGRRRRGRLIGTVAAVAVVAGGATALVAVLEHHGGGPAAPGPSPSGGRSTAARNPATGPVLPAGYVGTWLTSFTTELGVNTRTLMIRPDGTAELRGDSPSYHCVWSMRVTSTAPRVELSPSKVFSGSPAGSCNPGEATVLTLLDANRLRRDNADGDRAPLTYRRAG
ncbi:serine/threonine-protein kinase [Actinacidiphila acididurans]|uniref:Serine/threonine protein kinase n=1 Tax=Actinacidiphila acididurans TaxID=2784346 RepID=A0ABS2U039_9ACTN|nr:serine/threonine-protein kinase [Actinacidiphila acididurans]MBM9508967.1 serine/threonine protein kinase [Actinacidiphila acididurans]